MSIVDRSNHSSGKNPMFTFEHNAQYQQVQFRFLDAVQSYNPQNIAVSRNKFLLFLFFCLRAYTFVFFLDLPLFMLESVLQFI